MKHWTIRLSLPMLMIGLVAALGGCPGTETVEVWVINSSGSFIVTSVKLMDSDTTVELVEDAGVEADTMRTLPPTPQEPFAGETVTVVLTGSTDGIVDSAETMVTLPGTLAPGEVIPVLVSGENALSFDAEYIPLDQTSKLRQQLKAHAH